MYYGGRSSSTYSEGRSYGKSYYNYSSDLSSYSSRNPSIQRLLNSEYGRPDRSLSPSRDYSSRTTAFRQSSLSSDTSPTVGKRDFSQSDNKSSLVSYRSDDLGYSAKSRNYYDFPSTSTSMFISYSSPIKKPRRIDYSDYFRPVLTDRPMLKTGYVPRSRAERDNSSTPITRDRRLIKFRETSDEVIEKIRRKISWDLPEEINSPFIEEMKHKYADPADDKSAAEQAGSRRGSKDAFSCTPLSSPISGSPRPSISRRSSGDQSLERPIRPPMRKNSRTNNVIVSSIDNVHEHFESKTDDSSLHPPIPPPRKKSIGSTHKGRKSRKSSLDILLSEEKTQNYSKIAEDIRRSREIAESIQKLAEVSSEQNRRSSQPEETELNGAASTSDATKESTEAIPDRGRRRRRRISIPEPDTVEEKPPEIRRRSRSRFASQDSNDSLSPTANSNSTINEKLGDEAPRPASRMHRKSVKYKSDGLPPRRSSKVADMFPDSDISSVQKMPSTNEPKDFKSFKTEIKSDSNIKSDLKKIGKDVSKTLSHQKLTTDNKVKLDKDQQKSHVGEALLKSKLEQKETSSAFTPLVKDNDKLLGKVNKTDSKTESTESTRKGFTLENKMSNLKNISIDKTLMHEKKETDAKTLVGKIAELDKKLPDVKNSLSSSILNSDTKKFETKVEIKKSVDESKTLPRKDSSSSKILNADSKKLETQIEIKKSAEESKTLFPKNSLGKISETGPKKLERKIETKTSEDESKKLVPKDSPISKILNADIKKLEIKTEIKKSDVESKSLVTKDSCSSKISNTDTKKMETKVEIKNSADESKTLPLKDSSSSKILNADTKKFETKIEIKKSQEESKTLLPKNSISKILETDTKKLETKTEIKKSEDESKKLPLKDTFCNKILNTDPKKLETKIETKKSEDESKKLPLKDPTPSNKILNTDTKKLETKIEIKKSDEESKKCVSRDSSSSKMLNTDTKKLEVKVEIKKSADESKIVPLKDSSSSKILNADAKKLETKIEIKKSEEESKTLLPKNSISKISETDTKKLETKIEIKKSEDESRKVPLKDTLSNKMLNTDTKKLETKIEIKKSADEFKTLPLKDSSSNKILNTDAKKLETKIEIKKSGEESKKLLPINSISKISEKDTKESEIKTKETNFKALDKHAIKTENKKPEEKQSNESRRMDEVKNVALKESLSTTKISEKNIQRPQTEPDPVTKLKPNVPYTKETEEIVIVCKLPKKIDLDRKKSIPNEQKVIVSIKGSELKTVDVSENSSEPATFSPDVSKIIPIRPLRDSKLETCDIQKSPEISNIEVPDVNVTHTIVLKPKAQNKSLDGENSQNVKIESNAVHLKPIPDVIKSTVSFGTKESDDMSDVVKSTLSKTDDQIKSKKLVLPDIKGISPEKSAFTSEAVSSEKGKCQLKQIDNDNNLTASKDVKVSKDLLNIKKSNSTILDNSKDATTKANLNSIKKSSSAILNNVKETTNEKPTVKPDLIEMTTKAVMKVDEKQIGISSKNILTKKPCVDEKKIFKIQSDKDEYRTVQLENKKDEKDKIDPTSGIAGDKLSESKVIREKVENKVILPAIQPLTDIKKDAEDLKNKANKNITFLGNEGEKAKHMSPAYKKSVTVPDVNALLQQPVDSRDKESCVTNAQKSKKHEPASLSTGDVPTALKGEKYSTQNQSDSKALKIKNDTTDNLKTVNSQTKTASSSKAVADSFQLPKINSSDVTGLKELENQTETKVTECILPTGLKISESDKKLSLQKSNDKENTVLEQIKYLPKTEKDKTDTKLHSEIKSADSTEINKKAEAMSVIKETTARPKSLINAMADKENGNQSPEKSRETLILTSETNVVKNSMPKISNITSAEKDKQKPSPESLKLPALPDTTKHPVNLSQQDKNSSPQTPNEKLEASKITCVDNEMKKNKTETSNLEVDEKCRKITEKVEPKVIDKNKTNKPISEENIKSSEEQGLKSKTDKETECLSKDNKTKSKEETPALQQQVVTEVTKGPEPSKARKPKLPVVPIQYKRFGLFIRPKDDAPKTILESSSSEEESETETETESETSSEEETPVEPVVNKASTLANGKYPDRNEKSRSHSETSNSSISSNISNSTTCTVVPSSWDGDHVGSPKRIEKALKFRKYGIDDFVFLKLLGKGSFGKVLLAELKNTECYFAIKCLKKDVVLEDDDVESTMIERRVLALGTQHPYMCKLYCAFQTKSYLYFVMEYLNGGDLMFHIQESGRFEEKRAMFYGAEIVSALKFLHKRGIVYRDIKLDNIMLDEQGHVRIVDFGMCQLRIYKEDCMPSNFCGTPTYISPEIVMGQKYNQSVDWWSFGVLLYEMLIGRSPFQGTDEDELFWSICNEEPHYPRFLSKEATHILGLLLVKAPSKRLGMPSCPAGDIKDHAFFKAIDWDKIENKETPPSFRPSVSGPCDTSNFDSSFTMDSPTLSPIDSDVLKSMDQEQFNGFSYTNPHLTA